MGGQVALNGVSSAISAIPCVGYLGGIGISFATGTISAFIDGEDIVSSLLQGVKSAGITAIAGGITRGIGLGKMAKIGKGKYSGKKNFLNDVTPTKLKIKLSSFNPDINKTQSFLKYIYEGVGLRGLSRISNDTAGIVVDSIFNIVTSIIP